MVSKTISKESKDEIIQRFSITKQKVIRLETRLRLQKKTDKADEVAKKSKALQKEIDKLIAQVMNEWLGKSSQLINDIKKQNAQLQRSITNIRKKVKFAKNFVKAMGLIDGAIKTAKRIL